MSKNDNGVVRIFSARACAAPLEEAAALFEKQNGIKVEISVCNRHCASPKAEEATGQTGGDDFLLEIADAGVHDLAIAGAEYLLDDGEVRGIVRKGQRRTIAYRSSAIVVPAGNPAGIASIGDLTRPGVRVGISLIDCLKGLWEDLAARLGVAEQVRQNITFRANGCVAIVEAVSQGVVDAAFGWSSFHHLAPDKVEIISLPDDQVIMRGTCVGMLSFSKNQAGAAKFMDFLTTQEVRNIYVKNGWVMPARKA